MGELRIGRVDGAAVSRAQVVQEARVWLGTPFLHQSAMKGVGTDCGGMVRGVLVSLGLLQADYKRHLPADAFGYSRHPDGATMKGFCDALFEEISFADAQPGDMGLFRFHVHPQHTAIFGDYAHGGLSMIHASGPGGPSKVVEHRLDDAWRKRLVCAYRFPGVV